MSEEYKIVQVDKPDDSAWGVIGGGIHHYNIQKAGDDQGKQVCFILYGPSQEIVGGLIGETHWGWFYINLLFVKDELRGCGYGHRLLLLAEDEARKRGAKHVYLDSGRWGFCAHPKHFSRLSLFLAGRLRRPRPSAVMHAVGQFLAKQYGQRINFCHEKSDQIRFSHSIFFSIGFSFWWVTLLYHCTE
jgi:GNAT superfamily N-acetyltransferase